MENILIILIVVAWIGAMIWQDSTWKERRLSLAEKVYGFLSFLIIIVLYHFMMGGG